jgi:hypothetical protein
MITWGRVSRSSEPFIPAPAPPAPSALRPSSPHAVPRAQPSRRPWASFLFSIRRKPAPLHRLAAPPCPRLPAWICGPPKRQPDLEPGRPRLTSLPPVHCAANCRLRSGVNQRIPQPSATARKTRCSSRGVIRACRAPLSAAAGRGGNGGGSRRPHPTNSHAAACWAGPRSHGIKGLREAGACSDERGGWGALGKLVGGGGNVGRGGGWGEGSEARSPVVFGPMAIPCYSGHAKPAVLPRWPPRPVLPTLPAGASDLGPPHTYLSSLLRHFRP